MTTGSCLATLLTFAWARVESLPALYAVWGLMGLAMAATLYEPPFAVVVSWFREGRDRALLTYYVSDNKTGRISSRFRSLPVSWLYAAP